MDVPVAERGEPAVQVCSVEQLRIYQARLPPEFSTKAGPTASPAAL